MSKTKADKQWLDDVSSLCCIACRNAGLGPQTPFRVARFGDGRIVLEDPALEQGSEKNRQVARRHDQSAAAV